MFFGQKIHPLNFAYGERVSPLPADPAAVELTGSGVAVRVRVAELASLGLRVSLDNAGLIDPRRHSDAVRAAHREAGTPVPAQAVAATAARPAGFRFAARTLPGLAVTLTPAGLSLDWAEGAAALEPPPDGGGLGANGPQTTVRFALGRALAAHGFGERTGRLNKLGQSLECWNVDVVAVHPHNFARDDYDPTYVSVPWAVLRLGRQQYCGLYFDNPDRVVMDVGRLQPDTFQYQSPDSPTDLYLLPGPSLAQVVRRFAALTGRADLPPLWSLGYHQCRWGYRSAEEFRRLRDQFVRHQIPVSALWYDIDYMDGYRLFTWNQEAFPAPGKLNEELLADGIHAVVIVDPGVKREEGYAVYDEGRRAGAFCRTASGRDYVGLVWPGETVFPDFTRPETRSWWARRLGDFVEAHALSGVWLDMNDPATGLSSSDEMLFDQGRAAHAKYHNQYAHFMAQASHAAFERFAGGATHRARPFLLTRSACAGTQRHSALWTGDNVASWEQLRMSIPCSLNLGLSGFAFTGPDVGGFMGHVTEELMVRWHQAGFLFPFFRNHAIHDSRRKEPWEFGPLALARLRDVIQTRYRLLPYLYQCFFRHCLEGDPILRPLCYHYDDPGLANLEDQFLVGEALMAAPLLRSSEEQAPVMVDGQWCHLRPVVLPGDRSWFDLNEGRWWDGGQTLWYPVAADAVPLFVRDGSVLPCDLGPWQRAPAAASAPRALELHVFSRGHPAELTYHHDDQLTRAWAQGVHRPVRVRATVPPPGTATAGGGGEEGWSFAAEAGGEFPELVPPRFAPVYYPAGPAVLDREPGRRHVPGPVAAGTGGPPPACRVRTSLPPLPAEAGSVPLRPETRRWVSRDLPVLTAAEGG